MRRCARMGPNPSHFCFQRACRNPCILRLDFVVAYTGCVSHIPWDSQVAAFCLRRIEAIELCLPQPVPSPDERGGLPSGASRLCKILCQNSTMTDNQMLSASARMSPVSNPQQSRLTAVGKRQGLPQDNQRLRLKKLADGKTSKIRILTLNVGSMRRTRNSCSTEGEKD